MTQQPPANPGARYVIWFAAHPTKGVAEVHAAYDMREDEARRSFARKNVDLTGRTLTRQEVVK